MLSQVYLFMRIPGFSVQINQDTEDAGCLHMLSAGQAWLPLYDRGPQRHLQLKHALAGCGLLFMSTLSALRS